APGVDSERLVICEAICSCKDVRASSPGKGPRPSDCVTARLRAYDHALGDQSTIKAEVPYDMSQNPPVPIMSRYQPTRPTTSKPGGSKAPDVVLVKDPTKPPTQDNIKKIIEIKFPGDRWRPGQEKAYERIAGGVPIDRWTPDTCGCKDEEKERERV